MNKEIRKKNINNVLFFDIETVSREKELTEESELYELYGHKTRDRETDEWLEPDELKRHFKKWAALKAPYNKVVCISVGFVALKNKNHEQDTIYTKCLFGEEKDIIEEFYNILNAKVNAKGVGALLCGYNTVGFDMPMLEKKAAKHNIHSLHSYYSHVDQKPWEVNHLDLMKIWRATGYENESLDEVCMELGVKSPKDKDISGEKVSQVYWDGERELIYRYCNKDVVSVINVFRVMQGKEQISEVIDKTVYEKQAKKGKKK